MASKPGATVHDLDSLWRGIPLAQRDQLSLRVIYLRILIDLGGHSEAEKQVVAWLTKDWQVELLGFLGRSSPDNPRKLLKKMRKWLETCAQDALLFLAAARVALYAEEWDAAGQWLEAAYQRGATAEICCELARFCAARGDQPRADQLFAEAAALCVGPLPEVPLPDAQEAQ